MEKGRYLKLQNGSDVRGYAVADEGHAVELDAQAAAAVSAAFASWLSAKSGKPASSLRLGIGHDSRITADALSKGCADGFASAGTGEIFACGLCTTPSVFLSTKLEASRFDGAVMVTASHMPFNRNGLKFFTGEGGLSGAELKEVLEIAEAGEGAAAGAAEGKVEDFDLAGAYSEHMRQLIRNGCGGSERPLEGLKIAVDAGNGASGFFAEQILAPLGADVSASRYLEPDGYFPNHVPNPENAGAMAAITEAVTESGADLGCIFDCDGDRAAVVLKGGIPANRNDLIALLAAILAPEHPGATIVTDSVTSDELAAFIASLGLKHYRYRRGYKNVIGKGLELTEEGIDCPLAIETSGHGAFKENYFSDDGAYICAKCICAMARLKAEGRELSDLIAGLGHPKEACEIRIKITEEDFKACGAKILDDFKAFAESDADMTVVEPNYEGVRVSFADADGWALLRMSLHEPLLPLNVESRKEGGAEAIILKMKAFFEGTSGVDLSAFDR